MLPLTRRLVREHHPDPLNPSTKGWRSAVKEGELPTSAWQREVARGLVNYSAAEARRIMGRPSLEIAPLLGYQGDEELIHRDNLVLC